LEKERREAAIEIKIFATSCFFGEKNRNLHPLIAGCGIVI
jgi:hypothetical protein